MKYGIICALQSEIALLLQDIVIKNSQEIAMRTFYEGELYGKDVVMVMSRIGKVASSVAATILINNFAVDNVIFCGTAGGIDKDLNVGDVVVGDKSVQHDFWAGEPFVIPRDDIAYFESEKSLVNALVSAINDYINTDLHNDIPKEHLEQFNIVSPKTVIGTVASGDQFICDGSKNDWLRENVYNVKCVEMEGAAVAQVCYEFKTPFAVTRVISDSASDSAGIDFDSFVLEAACYFTRGMMKAFLLAQ